MARILVVDDDAKQRRMIQLILEGEGHSVLQADGVGSAMDTIEQHQPEIVLTDLKMPGESGLALVEKNLGRPNAPEIIVVTAFGTIETAVKAIRLGAYDYLSKPINPEELLFVIEKAKEKFDLRQESRNLHQALTKEMLSDIVAESTAMQNIMGMVDKVAASDSTVLIYGETGTGKECVARLIHLRSKRCQHLMCCINCAAFTESILESELFGYEKGAFTGAHARRIGLIESASGSTLFLDEVADMSLNTQARLLRVLQEKEIRRVGGNEAVPVDIRIIAATNKKLEEAVRHGTFREDLFYRLNVVPILIPPLRERRDDIPALARHFVSKLGRRMEIEDAALSKMMTYDWPGNVRELETIIERMVVLSNDPVISAGDLPFTVPGKPRLQPLGPWELPEDGILFEDLEKHLLGKALERANGNMSVAAKLLGMTYRTFRYRANTFGLK